MPAAALGVFAAGTGVLVPGLTGRRIGVLAGAELFLVTVAVVAWARRRRYRALARGACRAGRHGVLQDRAVSVRAWRRGHRRWLLPAFVAAPGSSFALLAAGGMLPAGAGAGLWRKAAWLGRLERSEGALPRVRVDRLGKRGGRPAGKAVRAYRTTGLAAGDAAPGGARRRTAEPVRPTL
ncbi:hypothetical protein ACFYNZ_18410 [Streptomyces kebangsaanensis]|uniref:Integral membrane protein n=1 Tax=Streptomyces kebangsaanensis TaxID=864058 RepID=A0ABW6KUB6_9ACTN